MFRETIVRLSDRLDHAQQAALGPREDRTPIKPTKPPKGQPYKGGAIIERSCRSNGPSRSYTLGPSREKQAKIIAPACAGKVKSANAEFDENLALRSEFIHVRISNMFSEILRAVAIAYIHDRLQETLQALLCQKDPSML
jgi:hypothetical protein